MPNPSELQRAEEEQAKVSREAWRNREETEHAPRNSRSLSDLYEEALDRANNLKLGKESREFALREARRLAEELGIEGPPPINGRSANQLYVAKDSIIERSLLINGRSANRLYVAKDIKLSIIERSLLIDALLYCGIMTDGREPVRVSLIERLRALD